MSTEEESVQVETVENVEPTETVSESPEGAEAAEPRDDYVEVIEKEARAEGWDPDFKGDPRLKKTAEEFVRDGRHIKKVLNTRNEKLKEENAKLLGETGELKVMLRKLINFNAEHEARVNADKLAELKNERDQAVFAGDVPEVDRVQDEMQKVAKRLDETSKETAPDGAAEWRDLTAKWKEENTWYDSDPYLAAEADAIGKRFAESGRFKNDRTLLDAITKRMSKEYPEELGTAAGVQRKPPLVNSSRGNSVTAPSTVIRRVADAPKNYKEAYEIQRDIIGKGSDGKWIYSEAEFLKRYQP